jgi:hypothetical protein
MVQALGMSNNTQSSPKLHRGTCHCGAVQFEATLALETVTRCNCSICTKTAWVGALMKPEAFKLVLGDADLSSYEWGGKTAKRHFCKHCGVQVYAAGFLEEVGGAYVSINVNALDDVEIQQLPLIHWDGRHNNWEAGPRPTPWPIHAEAE